MIGKRFGRWTVIERGADYFYNEKPSPQWTCICECGEIRDVSAGSLKRGKSLSCGCLHREITSKLFTEELAGQVFGRLTVLERAESYKRTDVGFNTQWLCLCSCGNKKVILASSLKTGNTVSCGCYFKERRFASKFKDITGKRYGKLLVLSYSHANRRTYWNCVCDCGKEILKSYDDLTSGKCKSCGCLRESFIASELKKYFVENHGAKAEYKLFQNAETKQYYKCDIVILKHNIYIEVHGQQHYKLNAWHRRGARFKNTTPEEEFEKQKKRDKLVRKYCRQKGIYIEINIEKEKDLNAIISYIESKIENMENIN